MVHAIRVGCFPILLFKVLFLTTSIRDVVYSATLCFCSLYFSLGAGGSLKVAPDTNKGKKDEKKYL